MAKLIFKGIRMEAELVASINETAAHFGVTFSKVVRDALREKYGLLRLQKMKRRP